MKQIVNSDLSLYFKGEGKKKQDVFHMLENDKPDVLIVDSELIDKNDLKIVKQMLQSATKPEVILIADEVFSKKYFMEAINSCVKGFLLQDINDGLFINAIKTVHQNQYWIHPQMSHYLMSVNKSLNQTLNVTNRKNKTQRPLHTLTKREFEVLELLVMGYGNNTIMAEMKITNATVKTHIRNILKKLDVSNRTQAVLVAIHNRWVELNCKVNLI